MSTDMFPQGFIDYMDEQLKPAQFVVELEQRGISVDISPERIWTSDTKLKSSEGKYFSQEWTSDSYRDDTGQWVLNRHIANRIVDYWHRRRYPAANT